MKMKKMMKREKEKKMNNTKYTKIMLYITQNMNNKNSKLNE